MEILPKVSNALLPFWNDSLKDLHSCQPMVNEVILPAINDPKGYGYGAPEETKDIWKLVRNALDYMRVQWTQALKKMEDPMNQRSEIQDAESIADLVKTLDEVCQNISSWKKKPDRATHGGISDISGKYTPCYDPLKPELGAYSDLLVLHQVARHRGWTTDEGFTKALDDPRLKEGDFGLPMVFQYFTFEDGEWVSKDPTYRVPHH